MDSLAFVGMLGARSEQSPPRAKGSAHNRVGTVCLAQPGPPYNCTLRGGIKAGSVSRTVGTPCPRGTMIIVCIGSVETAAVRRPRQERLVGVRIDG